MPAAPALSAFPSAKSKAVPWAFALVLVAAAACAYSNSLGVPFQFDDEFAIAGNLSIRHWATALSPPTGTSVGGRPVVNALFALNFAAGGLDVRGYHLLNLSLHCLAGLLVYGIVSRSLAHLRGREGSGECAGFVTALIWIVHPLQTESVTYLSQRSEAAMGLFYLATLYAFLRSASSPRRAGWATGAVVACALGMGSKEVMVSAPVVVLAYDALIVSKSFSGAIRARRSFYLALAATWIPLAVLVASTGGDRGGSTGFHSGITWGEYLATQFPAITRYLRLVLWPAPLVFDYGAFRVDSFASVAPEALLVVLLIGATAWGVAQRRPSSFLGVWFLAVLAPTSIVPGAIQMIAEHRMYLPSVAVICGLVLAAEALVLRLVPARGEGFLVGTASLLAAALATGTYLRNTDYRSPLSLWADTALKRPDHALAHYNYANELAKDPGTLSRAITEYERALALRPHLPPAQYNFAVLLEGIPGRAEDAVSHYRQAVADQPDYLEAQNNLGAALARLGRLREAVGPLRKAHQLAPQSAAIARNLGTTCFLSGDYEGAVSAYLDSLRVDPRDVTTQKYVASAFFKLGRLEEAQAHANEALRLEQGR